MAASMSKEEYLKRYLSGGESGDKKKKKKKKKLHTSHGSGLKIIDEDVDLKSLIPGGANNLQEEDDDETPTVAEFVDERPKHVIEIEEYRKNTKWKVLTNQDDKNSSRGTESDVDDGISNRDVRKKRHDSDSDQSPQRKQRHDSDSDQSPPRKQRHDSDSDQSPPRKQRHDSNSDQSPPRKKRHDSDSDQSPPRKKRHDSDSDQSPPRKKRHDSDSDQSPPRKKRHDSDSDQSPPRKKRHDSGSDQSPPRKNRHDSDQSPERKQRHRKRWDSPKSDTLSNNSSKRDKKKNSRWNNRGSDSDQSPPRKHRKHSPSSSRSSHSREDSNRGSRKPGDRETAKGTDDKGRATKTLSGATAGLSSAKAMRQEAQKLRDKEDAAFNQIDAELLGRNATTVFRDKSGRKRNLQQEGEEDSKKAKEQAERNKQYQIWGKGLTQQAKQEEQVQMALHEANKPLARYKDDDDLDAMLRNQEREGDPMLAFLKKKKTNEKEKKKELPKYKGPAPPMNRYGIQPGYRWDGVNRSNGFEKKLFTKQADRKATEMMAYKWSTEDM